MSISNKAEFFLNFQQFGNLKLEAKNESQAAARNVAQQFEGLFIQQMLSAMRAAAKVDENQHSSYLDFYQETYDKQMAQTLAAQDRLGVARMILQQLPGGNPAEPPLAQKLELNISQPQAVTAGMKKAVTAIPLTAAQSEPLTIANKPVSEAPDVVLNPVSANDFAEVEAIASVNDRWQQRDQFVADLLPLARPIAEKLGVSAELLVAQAALETGWGKHTMKFDDGRNSFNLFGIKARSDWQGNVLERESTEFINGHELRQVSRFRAYHSPAESLQDYAEFIQSSPRYAEALKANDDHAYLRAIHQAGYATDPHYADKIIDILNGRPMRQALASIHSGVTSHA
ncbi:MAG: flagellar assembly peptidoglycan hydrolase FlgJ [Pseudomonadota bacterium]